MNRSFRIIYPLDKTLIGPAPDKAIEIVGHFPPFPLCCIFDPLEKQMTDEDLVQDL